MKEYVDLVNEILFTGENRSDRTGTGTISIFGTQTKYDIRKGFPILTTKKVNFTSVVKELLWFLRGETNIKTLGCKIWDPWAAEDGSLSKVYGSQWRTWGGRGIDQIEEAVRTIKENPYSRRIIVSAWNVEDLPIMALPPCHILFQFYVSGDRLDCQLYQRSADMALGVPFNVASYALLTTIIAGECDLIPGIFIHTIGDAHIYNDHIQGMIEQIKRKPYSLPSVEIRKRIKDETSPGYQSWNDYLSSLTVDDVKLVGYKHHDPISYTISV